MVLGTLMDDLLDSMGAGPSLILPSQLARSQHATAEMRLYIAVLEDAIRIYKRDGAKRKPKIRDDVIEWFFDDGGRGPFSFRGICEVVGIDPDAFRDRVRADAVGTPLRRQALRIRAA